jgi:hypothetical protein
MAEDSDRNGNGVSKRITELGEKVTQLLLFLRGPLSVRDDSLPFGADRDGGLLHGKPPRSPDNGKTASPNCRNGCTRTSSVADRYDP